MDFSRKNMKIKEMQQIPNLNPADSEILKPCMDISCPLAISAALKKLISLPKPNHAELVLAHRNWAKILKKSWFPKSFLEPRGTMVTREALFRKHKRSCDWDD